MRKVYIHSIGCVENTLEGSRIAEFFRRNHWQVTERPSEADLLLVNTCGVIGSKERQSVHKIQQLSKIKKNGARLVTCGCLPDINQEALQDLAHADIVTPTTMSRFNRIADAKVPIEDVSSNHVISKHMRLRLRGIHLMRLMMEKLQQWRIPVPPHFKRVFYCFEEPHWHYIKICSGCLHHCSFCAIKFAKGHLVSQPIDKIMQELRDGLQVGHRSVVLAGDDTGAYGRDLNTDLVDLLNAMISEDGDFDIYIRNLEPAWFIRMFDRLKPVCKSGKVRGITLPVQSGSPRILKDMNRAHSIEDFRNCVAELNQEVPDLLIITHIMVGFPGETEADFKQTLKLLSDLRFDGVSPEQYYPRPGIPALKLPNPVPAWKRRWRLIRAFAYVYYLIYCNKFNWRTLRHPNGEYKPGGNSNGIQ
jgi:threonylcarbamoyladenosine tRNA methylthiotransferase CDKAL1